MSHDERKLLLIIARAVAEWNRDGQAPGIRKLIKRIQRHAQIIDKDKRETLARMLDAGGKP